MKICTLGPVPNISQCCIPLNYLAWKKSDAPSNILFLIPNEFGTVLELGVQRLETLEELEIRYSQALAKPKRETNSHNRLLEAL